MALEGMVHALREAHRVLKPNGALLDLRPVAKHRRAGLGEGRRWKFIGAMQEDLDSDHKANRAVAEVMRTGLFHRQARLKFGVDRVMDDLDDFRAFLDEFGQLGKELPSHDWLVERMQASWQPATKITVRGLLMLGVLRKRDIP